MIPLTADAIEPATVEQRECTKQPKEPATPKVKAGPADSPVSPFGLRQAGFKLTIWADRTIAELCGLTATKSHRSDTWTLSYLTGRIGDVLTMGEVRRACDTLQIEYTPPPMAKPLAVYKKVSKKHDGAASTGG